MNLGLVATVGEAIAQAAVVAAELGQDESWHGFSVHIANEHGKEVARVPDTALASQRGVRLEHGEKPCRCSQSSSTVREFDASCWEGQGEIGRE
jgi:hypothetical protein